MRTRVLAVAVALMVAGCDVPWDFSAPFPDTGVDTAADTSADEVDAAPGTPCDIEVESEPCCTVDNPCGWSDNGTCDCASTCTWDIMDCGATLVPPPVDLIIVMDNSATMSEEQTMLGEMWPQLVHDLLIPSDHMPIVDIHIGVISTDMGTGGWDLPTCTNPDAGDDGVLLLDPTQCPEIPFNFTGYCEGVPAAPGSADELGAQVACITAIGTDGCSWEQHLKAMQAAIDKSQPGMQNDGFLRTDSILAVLFVTDEDDCSVDPEHPEMFEADPGSLGPLGLRCFNHPEFAVQVGEYVTFLGNLREPDTMIAIGVLAGVPPDGPCVGVGSDIGSCLDSPEMMEQVADLDPNMLAYSCEGPMGAAFPPRKLVSLAMGFGDTSIVGSICDDSYFVFTQGFADRIGAAVDMHAHY